MNLQLYFAPAACSLVPHVGLEAPPVAAAAAGERIALHTYKG